MRYFFDTEFIERPCTIDLVSIGIVAEDGREFYAENEWADLSRGDDWFKANVVPHLRGGDAQMGHEQIGLAILDFLGEDEAPEFWAYYADYDWVAFCWLFGRMVDLPEGFPMFCRDLKQWAVDLGSPDLPKQVENEHDALADARWNRAVFDFLAALTASEGMPTDSWERPRFDPEREDDATRLGELYPDLLREWAADDGALLSAYGSFPEFVAARISCENWSSTGADFVSLPDPQHPNQEDPNA